MKMKKSRPINLPPDYKTKLKQKILDLIEIDSKGCWIWKLSKCKPYPYGQITIRHEEKIMRTTTHRISYCIWKGDIPENVFVLHTCHEYSCCNPDHLYLGDHKQNMKDMREAGRVSDKTGCKNQNAKLKEIDVVNIRELHAKGLNNTEISIIYGITHQNIHRIVKNISWRHI